MVYSPGGATPPRKRHYTREAAAEAAEDLARIYRTQEFYVMEALSVSAAVDIRTTVLK